jgi:protein-disulfide isomerase
MSQDVKIIGGIIVATLVILVGGVFFMTKSEEKKQQAVSDPNVLVKPFNHRVGSDSAKVTIVEFADFQCPACRNAHPTLKQIVETYKDKINFVYRHFPLPQHKNARLAAKAAEAAGEQGKFWEIYGELYNNQSEWEASGKPDELFIKYAKNLELDVEDFTDSLKSDKHDANIQQDISDGVSLGVNSTPSFFINGKKLDPPFSYDHMKEEIEAALKK